MKKLLVLFAIILLQYQLLLPQTVRGRLINLEGDGLAGLQLNLYIFPNVYVTTSATDGTFAFSNITGVGDETILPSGYDVSNNYPNPFNPKTRINVTLPQNGKVKIDIFDLLGQLVFGGKDNLYNAGNNNIDLELEGLANGVYLARVTIDEKYTVIRKLMLLYGSQHLSENKINNSSNALAKTTLDIKIDSLVITGSAYGKKVINDLPNITTNDYDIGEVLIAADLIINSINKHSATPCEFITFTLTGLDTTASLTAYFTDKDNFIVDVPVKIKDATTATAIVPPFINNVSGNIDPGVVSIVISQSKGSNSVVSNFIDGFQIKEMPQLTLTPGAVASNVAGFLELTITDLQNRLISLDASSGGSINTVDLRTQFENIRNLFGQLKTKIRQVMTNPNTSEVVGTLNGIEVTLDQDNLRILDQWMIAMLKGISAEMPMSFKTSIQYSILMKKAINSEIETCYSSTDYLATLMNSIQSEHTAQQQYNQTVLPSFRDKLNDLGLMFGAGSALLGISVGLIAGSVPLAVAAALAVPSMVIMATQMQVDATMLYINENDITATKGLLNDFNEFIKSTVTGTLSPIIGAISPKAGICFDFFTGTLPLFESRLENYITQVREYIKEKLSSETWYGTTTGDFASIDGNGECNILEGAYDMILRDDGSTINAKFNPGLTTITETTTVTISGTFIFKNIWIEAFDKIDGYGCITTTKQNEETIKINTTTPIFFDAGNMTFDIPLSSVVTFRYNCSLNNNRLVGTIEVIAPQWAFFPINIGEVDLLLQP